MNLDLSSKLEFDNVDITPPNVVANELAEQIKKETNGIIKGTVTSYSKGVFSYRGTGLRVGVSDLIPSLTGLPTPLVGLHASLESIAEKKANPQNELGKIGEKTQEYEFYLTTPSFEQYKYRICFLQFGIANYPVSVVLEQSIADSINERSDSNYIISCKNRKEFEDLMCRVILSKRVLGVMQELINIDQTHNSAKSSNRMKEVEYSDIPNKK